MFDSSPLRKMLVGATLLCATVLIAVLGYVSAGWEVIDAVYMIVITVFGVGYGEVQPITTTTMKLFTMFIVISGCSTGIYVVGGFIQMIAEGEIHRAMGARRMSRGIQLTSNHVIICGYGRVGQILANELRLLNQPLVCVDSNPERIMQAEEKGFLVVLGNAGEEETLLQAGIERARVLAAVLPDDAANVFITLTAREIREDIEIIARGEYVATKQKLIRSGANHVVLPAAIGASKIANMIAFPNSESLVADAQQRERLNGGLACLGLTLQEVHVADYSEFVQCKVFEIESVKSTGTIVAAIKSANGTVCRNPGRDTIVEAGDILYVLSHQKTPVATSI